MCVHAGTVLLDHSTKGVVGEVDLPPNTESLTPLHSTTSKPLFPQLLSFHIYLKLPGCPCTLPAHALPTPQNPNVPTFQPSNVPTFRHQPTRLRLNPVPSATFRLFNSLALFFPAAALCFQSLPASFPKTPGVGVSPRPFIPSSFAVHLRRAKEIPCSRNLILAIQTVQGALGGAGARPCNDITVLEKREREGPETIVAKKERPGFRPGP